MKFQKVKNYKDIQYGDCWFDLYHDFGNFEHEYFQFKGNKLLIKHKYRWDGATGIPDTKKNYVPAEIHDVIFQAVREGLIPRDRFKDANEELEMQYLERDGWKWWGRILNWGTSQLGYKFTKSDIIEVD